MANFDDLKNKAQQKLNDLTQNDSNNSGTNQQDEAHYQQKRQNSENSTPMP